VSRSEAISGETGGVGRPGPANLAGPGHGAVQHASTAMSKPRSAGGCVRRQSGERVD